MKNVFRTNIVLSLLLMCAAQAVSMKAQVIRLNAGWEFQRLDAVREEAVIKNQGADWSSQYNIEHLDAQACAPSASSWPPAAGRASACPTRRASSRSWCCTSGRACATTAAGCT